LNNLKQKIIEKNGPDLVIFLGIRSFDESIFSQIFKNIDFDLPIINISEQVVLVNGLNCLNIKGTCD
jgi:hypothetical protein